MTKHGEKLLIGLIEYVGDLPLTPDRIAILNTLKELKHYEVAPSNKSLSGSAYSEPYALASE
jgi:hypothetical protein